MRSVYRVLVGRTEGKGPLEDPGVDGTIILICIFRTWDGGHGQDRSDPGQGKEGGFCKRGNEPSGSVKWGEFLD
jgi:hypothetical protein